MILKLKKCLLSLLLFVTVHIIVFLYCDKRMFRDNNYINVYCNNSIMIIIIMIIIIIIIIIVPDSVGEYSLFVSFVCLFVCLCVCPSVCLAHIFLSHA